MKTALCICFSFLISYSLIGQTNPDPQALPYFQDYNMLLHSSTTYPTGMQGWLISTSSGPAFNTAPPSGNRAMSGNSSAATTAASLHNYNGKIGMLNSNIADLALCVALNTTGKMDVIVTYDVMTIRNPYNGSTNTRICEVALQYRVGVSGDFTTLTTIEYQNNTIERLTGTTPQNLQNRSVALPSGCNDKDIVQIRWASRQLSGTGSYPSFAFDNINVSASDITLPVVLTSFTAYINPHNHVALTWVTQSETNALGYYVYRGDQNDLETAKQVSDLIEATNTSQMQVYCYADQESLPLSNYWYWLESRDLDGSHTFHGPVMLFLGDQESVMNPSPPMVTRLDNPYPNPFNPRIMIPYQLARPTDVRITIFNQRGQQIRNFILSAKQPGSYRQEWDGLDDGGSACASGIYRIVFEAGGERHVGKAALLK